MTTHYLLPAEWRALLRNYVIGALVVGAMLFIAGFRCGRRVIAPDPAIAAEATRAKALEDSAAALRVVKDSLDAVTTALEAHLAVDSAKSAALHAIAIRHERGIVIDTASHFVAVSDTVAYADLMRANDERHYTIPKFFATSYMAMRADRNGLLIENRDLHDVVDVMTRKAALQDSIDTRNDSLNASLSRQIDLLQRRGHPWCAFKCGVVTTLAVLAGAAIVLHEAQR